MITQTKKSNKNFTTMIIIWAMIILFTGGMYVEAIIHANTSEDAFEDPPPPPEGGQSYTASSENLSIRVLIINGATNFLKAYRDTGDFSQDYESTDLNGFNITSLLVKANAATESINTAKEYYSQLETKANNTPYNQDVIGKLETFNYRGFRIEKGLNKQIMNDVEDYLSSGDVRGVYSRFVNDSNKIIQTLEVIKTSLEAGALPEKETIWNLNQDIAVMHIFGQYITRVFEEIK